MTITSTANTFEIASAGAGPSFVYPYVLHKATDLRVYVSGAKKEPGDGDYPYGVVVAGNKESATITFTNTVSKPVTGLALIFERILEYKQETDLANNSLFDAESLETSLDNIVMQVQQVGNVVLSAESSTTFSFDSGLGTGADMYESNALDASTLSKKKTARANKAVAFDSIGNITVTATDIDDAIDYQLEAEEWASLASGNVYSYSAGTRDADQGAISAKAQATASAGSATDSAASFTSFDIRYLGAFATTVRETGANVGKDNEGAALIDGAMYFDSTLDVMKVWDLGNSQWVQIKPTTAEQTAITAVNGDESDIGKVAAIDTEIGQLAVLGTAGVDITTVSNIGVDGADVSTVAGITAGDISKVAAITTGDVSKVAIITTGDVSKVAVITTGDVSKVAAVDGEVGDVAAIDTEIGTIVNGTDGVASTSGTDKNILLISNVNGKLTEIGNLGTTTVVGHMAALNATGVINNMATLNVAGVITDIETVADMDGEVNNFAIRYRVASSEPGTDNDAGDLYFNTTSNTLFTYGTGWKTASPSAADQANIDIVAGELTYEEDLGSIADAATTSSGNDITDVAALDTEIGLLAAKASEIGLLGTVEHATSTTGTLARLGVAAVVEDIGHLGTGPNVLAMAELGTSTVVGNIAALTATGVVTNIGTVATSIADVNRYAAEYIISGSEPSSPTPTEGDLWYDSTNNVLKYHNGTSFASISAELHNEMVQDTTPVLGGNLDADDNNLTNVGTISGDDLKVDFGSIA